MKISDSSKVLEIVKRDSVARVMQGINNELLGCDEDSRKYLMVSSATRGEGKSTLSLLYAAYMAENSNSRKILLINASDGDYDKEFPGLDSDDMTTLTGFLVNRKENEDFGRIIHKTAYDSIDYMKLYEHSGVYFPYEEFSDFLNTVSGSYDTIIVDSKPASMNPDVDALARLVKNVVLITKYGGSTYEQIKPVIKRFREVDANILGAIINERKYYIPQFLYR
jgi:Mrp family chromosome partitioning ATPase